MRCHAAAAPSTTSGSQARVEEQQFGAALQESTQGCGVAHLDDSVVRVEGGADLLQKTCGGGE